MSGTASSTPSTGDDRDEDVLTYRKDAGGWTRIEFDDLKPDDVAKFVDPTTGDCHGEWVIYSLPEPCTNERGQKTMSVQVVPIAMVEG